MQQSLERIYSQPQIKTGTSKLHIYCWHLQKLYTSNNIKCIVLHEKSLQFSFSFVYYFIQWPISFHLSKDSHYCPFWLILSEWRWNLIDITESTWTRDPMLLMEAIIIIITIITFLGWGDKKKKIKLHFLCIFFFQN